MVKGVHQKAARVAQRANKVIPGARSLHRGIHYHENRKAVKQFQSNEKRAHKRADPRELMVHHQKINDTLADIYARAHKLEEENLSREERIEQRWKTFERIGGTKPKPKATSHPSSNSPHGYAAQLEKVSEARKEERRRADMERRTGDIDLSKGSALHDMKDRRIKKFVTRQLDRAHMLRRMGDPTPMKQSGKFDRFTGTLNLFNKTKRQIEREAAHTAREQEARAARPGKKRGGGGGGGSRPRSQWDVHDEDRFSSQNMLRDASSQMMFGEHKRRGGGKFGKKSRR